MEQMKTVIAGLMICAALVTSCKKSSYDVVPAAANSPYSQSRTVDNQTMFSAGNLNATYLSIRSRGDLLAEFRGMRNYSLFDLLHQTGMGVQPGKYPHMETIIDIAPEGDQPALLLNGTWMRVDEAGHTEEAVPVLFMIHSPLRLTAMNDLAMVNDQSNLISLMNMQMEQLTANVPQELWRSAVDPATGRIIVSEQLNPHLHQLLMASLGGMIRITPAAGDPTMPGDNMTANTTRAGIGSTR